MDPTRHSPHLAVLVATLMLACGPDRTRHTTSPADPAAAPTHGPRTEHPSSPARESSGSTDSSHSSQPDADPEGGRLAGITAAHNRVRAQLGLPPLTWSKEIARYAKTWADRLQRKGCGLQHRPGSGPDAERYGENLFSASGQTPDVAQVVDSWAAEVKDYNAKTNRCKGVCGHYTQIVWRDSQRLGCAMATCGDTEVWVCNYDPPGNYVGQRPY